MQKAVVVFLIEGPDAPDPIVLFVDGDSEFPGLKKDLCGGQTGGPGADDADGLHDPEESRLTME